MEKLDLKNNKIEIILIFMSIKSGNLLQEDKKNLAELKYGKIRGFTFRKKSSRSKISGKKEGKSYKIYLKQKYSWQQLEK